MCEIIDYKLDIMQRKKSAPDLREDFSSSTLLDLHSNLWNPAIGSKQFYCKEYDPEDTFPSPPHYKGIMREVKDQVWINWKFVSTEVYSIYHMDR